MIKPSIIIGPPGTGKTTRLLQIMEDEMARGIDPRRIAFCSFTNKAASEAGDRAKEKFGYTTRDLPHFRTIHSMAFRANGCRRDMVMQPADYREIGKMLNITFSWRRFDEDGIPGEKHLGDRYAFLHGLAGAKMEDPEKVWHDVADDELNWMEFRRYCRTVDGYKIKKDKIDFNDMLTEDPGPIDVDVAIIDEAQDLSSLQWQFINRVFSDAERVYVAGDDDQAIFQWGGAAVNYFVGLEGPRTVLEQSYRVPVKIHAMAESIAAQIKVRVPKTYRPMDRQGDVIWHRNLDGINFDSGEWFLLARNIYHLGPLVSHMRDLGIPYTYRGQSGINPEHIDAIKAWEDFRHSRPTSTKGRELIEQYGGNLSIFSRNEIWHEALGRIPAEDREFYISLLRRGESLTKRPRVHINTIHGVKGGEADNVVLVTDITTKTREAMENVPDAEHRTFYVGATRAKETLYLMAPTTNNFYPM